MPSFSSYLAPVQILPPRAPKAPRRARADRASPDDRTLLRDLPVLVVDDDAPSAKLMSVLLRGEGCDVRTARSAEDALAMLDEFLPQVIVLDLILPMMSGLVLAERFRENVFTRDLVIIAVTVFDGPEAEAIARRSGCDAYVRKPIDAMTFADVVLTHLRRRQP